MDVPVHQFAYVGCWYLQAPMRTITFETGLDKQAVIRCLAQFAKDGKAYYEDSTIWVVKMRDHQATSNIKVTKRIEQDLDALPDTPIEKDTLTDTHRYPIDTLSSAEYRVSATR